MQINRRKFLKNSGLYTMGSCIPVSSFLMATESIRDREYDRLHTDYEEGEIINEIRKNGYSLIPAPQRSQLKGKDIVVDKNWSVVSKGGKDHALKSINESAKKLFGLKFSDTGNKKIILDIQPHILEEVEDSKLGEQGYYIKIDPDLIQIIGKGEPGLFYGVQSILQLLRPLDADTFTLPEGEISDWPDLQLRFIHWDSKHHQDRYETLTRYIDQAALFKINAIAFGIYDKYEYPSHPVIGAPGAFTKSEIKDLTAYALDRYIQLVPNVDAPSHFAYVLKHPQFAHLRAHGAERGSEYQACSCDPETIQLIFDLYKDMIEATPGVDYFLVGTDEFYYPGICGKCNRPDNKKNRSLAWVEFVNKAHEFLGKYNRQMICWVEFPLLKKDIQLLPSGIIDGSLGSAFISTLFDSGVFLDKEWIDEEKKAGIQQLAYLSIQGTEPLFPHYYANLADFNILKKANVARLLNTSKLIPKISVHDPDLTGTFAAAWDDSGSHNETFWLGWVTVTQYGWSFNQPDIKQSTADFMDVFYGYSSPDMIEIYRILDLGAYFYERLWRNPIAFIPPLPSESEYNINNEPTFKHEYSELIEEASKLLLQIERLIELLLYNITRVRRNKYNLEVLLSLAYLEQYSINTVLSLSFIEDSYLQAGQLRNDNEEVLKNWVMAHNLASKNIQERKEMWTGLVSIWETGQFKRNRSVDGKDYLPPDKNFYGAVTHERGLEYMLAPFRKVDLVEWREQMASTIVNFAEKHDLSVNGMTDDF